MEIVETHGVRLAYRRAGSGPPLVLAHGAGDDSRAWRPQLEAFAGELTVVAWDEPGAGGSSDPPAGFTLADHADCLGGLIEALELAPAHVGGLSWGGTVVLELYRRRPELVATLILADTYAGWKGSLPGAEVRARVESARRLLAAPPARFDAAIPGLFAGDPPAELVPLLAAMAGDVRPAGLEAKLGLMAEADLGDVLPRIEVPTLLVWGELDARSPLAVARRFERSIPDAQLVLIPEAGHLSNLEQPERFNQAVLEFCRRHRGQTSDE